MRKQRHQIYTNCPVEASLDLIGGKWKSIILFRVIEETRRFNELRRILPGLTQRMLTNQLRELEQDGLIMRKFYAEVPPKVEYSISEFGKTLEPVLLALKNWAEEQMLPRMNLNKKESGGSEASFAAEKISTTPKSKIIDF
jgi:DNA-binding HxlR family transcriptional regulator